MPNTLIPANHKIRFSRDSDEMACSKTVLGMRGSYACLRTDGHQGICIPLARAAGAADFLCFACRSTNSHHKKGCDALTGDHETERRNYTYPINYVEQTLAKLSDSQLAAINHPFGEILNLLAPLAREHEGAVDIVKRLIEAYPQEPA